MGTANWNQCLFFAQWIQGLWKAAQEDSSSDLAIKQKGLGDKGCVWRMVHYVFLPTSEKILRWQQLIIQSSFALGQCPRPPNISGWFEWKREGGIFSTEQNFSGTAHGPGSDCQFQGFITFATLLLKQLKSQPEKMPSLCKNFGKDTTSKTQLQTFMMGGKRWPLVPWELSGRKFYTSAQMILPAWCSFNWCYWWHCCNWKKPWFWRSWCRKCSWIIGGTWERHD